MTDKVFNFQDWLNCSKNIESNNIDIETRKKNVLEAGIDFLRLGMELYPSTFLRVKEDDVLTQCFDILIKNGDKYKAVILANQSLFDKELAEDWSAWSITKIPHINIEEISFIDEKTKKEIICLKSDSLLDKKSVIKTLNLKPEDFQPTVEDMALELASWRLIGQEAEQQSKILEDKIANQVDKNKFDNKNLISFGIARTKINKVFDPEKVDKKIVELMSGLNFSEEEIDSHYKKHPNFWIEGKVDADVLISLIQQHLQIDLRNDERFNLAFAEKKPNLATMVEFLNDLSNNQVNWDELIDWNQTTIKTELVKEALSGPTRKLRQTINANIRQEISPIATQAGKDYQLARAHILKIQNEERKSKATKSKKLKKPK